MSSIYKFKVRGLDGEEIDFANFKGKKILVVNVASECGFTPQYQQLQELQGACGDKIQIVGFPCNDFGGQEPGSKEEIRSFCTINYGVTFPLGAKVSIKGPQIDPLYRWLTTKAENEVMDSEVEWNFHKYLLDEAGRLIKVYPSSVTPLSEEILSLVQS